MNIILAVTGGIAAYKACDLIGLLKKGGHNVRVIMTKNAKEFITPLTLATLSKHPVMDNMWTERQGNVDHIDHIDVATWANVFVVYPATANIIGKFAGGIADDTLSTAFLALPSKVIKLIFPAMNTEMFNNPIVKHNSEFLQATLQNTFIMLTREGMLACGVKGAGCLLQPKDAIHYINEYTKESL